MRFSWKNFKAGKIDVILKTKEEYNEFMQRCEKKGFEWLSGMPPTYYPQYFTGEPLRITCGSFGALGKTTDLKSVYNTPTINYSEFALPAPADVLDRVPTLDEMALRAAILAMNTQKMKEALTAITATRAALCDAMAQFRKAYDDRLQAIKEEQSHNE